MTPSTTACAHQWCLYDVYCINPNFGNFRCEACGERRKGETVSDEQVAAYMKSTEMCNYD